MGYLYSNLMFGVDICLSVCVSACMPVCLHACLYMHAYYDTVVKLSLQNKKIFITCTSRLTQSFNASNASPLITGFLATSRLRENDTALIRSSMCISDVL